MWYQEEALTGWRRPPMAQATGCCPLLCPRIRVLCLVAILRQAAARESFCLVIWPHHLYFEFRSWGSSLLKAGCYYTPRSRPSRSQSSFVRPDSSSVQQAAFVRSIDPTGSSNGLSVFGSGQADRRSKCWWLLFGLQLAALYLRIPNYHRPPQMNCVTDLSQWVLELRGCVYL